MDEMQPITITNIETEINAENIEKQDVETKAENDIKNDKSGISYEELLELYKTSLDSQKQMAEDLKQMQQILNDNFKVTKNAPSTQEDEIEQYLSSSNSLTGRLLEKYEKEKR